MKLLLSILSAVAFITAPATFAHAKAYLSPRMLLEVVDIASPSISPDGKLVAFREEQASTERNTYLTAWYVQNLRVPGSKIRIADGGEAIRDVAGLSVSVAPIWSSDSRRIYFRALFGKEIQIWRASADGSGAEPVTQDEANVTRFVISQDGETLIYEVGAARNEIRRAEEAEYENGIRFDETVHGGQNLFRGFPFEGRLVSHRTFARRTLLGDEPKQYRAVHLHTLKTTDATQPEMAEFQTQMVSADRGLGGVRTYVVAPSGGRVAMVRRDGDDWLLEVRTTAGNSSAECQPCKSLVIDGVAWRDENEVVFTAREGQRSVVQALYAWRVGDALLRTVVKSGGLINSSRELAGSTCAAGTQYAVCVVASARIPPRLERIDLNSGDRLVLDAPNQRLELAGDEAANVEDIRWTDADGQEFSGYLFTPNTRDETPLPMFLTYYTCPGYIRGGYGDEWPLRSLASAGIAALCINSAPLSVSAVDDYNVALSAVSSVVDILDQRGVIDRERVGMGGLSFGGEVTTWIVTHSDLLSAASIANSLPSPAGYWARALMPGWAEAVRRRWGYGAPDETPDQWRVVSATYRIEDFNTPFLMQLPEGEYRGNIELYVRLAQAGKPVEMWVYPNETHQKYEPKHKLSVFERNLDWFRFWLQGVTDNDPRKKDQYTRWIGMRGKSEGAGLPL